MTKALLLVLKILAHGKDFTTDAFYLAFLDHVVEEFVVIILIVDWCMAHNTLLECIPITLYKALPAHVVPTLLHLQWVCVHLEAHRAHHVFVQVRNI